MEMNLSIAEVLNEVEKLAKLGLSIDEIEILLGSTVGGTNLNFRDKITDSSNTIGRAYLKGKYTLKVEILTSLKQLAVNGSSPAIERMIKQIDIQHNSE